MKVLKANWRLVEGADIYITFQAENKTTGAFDNFQAIIYVFVGVREVQLVRLEPKKSQLLQGKFWLLIYSLHNMIFRWFWFAHIFLHLVFSSVFQEYHL